VGCNSQSSGRVPIEESGRDAIIQAAVERCGLLWLKERKKARERDRDRDRDSERASQCGVVDWWACGWLTSEMFVDDYRQASAIRMACQLSSPIAKARPTSSGNHDDDPLSRASAMVSVEDDAERVDVLGVLVPAVVCWLSCRCNIGITMNIGRSDTQTIVRIVLATLPNTGGDRQRALQSKWSYLLSSITALQSRECSWICRQRIRPVRARSIL
jgi:hypothetical protein